MKVRVLTFLMLIGLMSGSITMTAMAAEVNDSATLATTIPATTEATEDVDSAPAPQSTMAQTTDTEEAQLGTILPEPVFQPGSDPSARAELKVLCVAQDFWYPLLKPAVYDGYAGGLFVIPTQEVPGYTVTGVFGWSRVGDGSVMLHDQSLVGKMPDGDYTVVVMYSRNPTCLVTLECRESGTGALLDSITVPVMNGAEVTMQAIPIQGYAPKREAVSGIAEEGLVLVIYYQRNVFQLTIEYRELGTELLLQAVEISSEAGIQHTLYAVPIQGYTPLTPEITFDMRNYDTVLVMYYLSNEAERSEDDRPDGAINSEDGDGEFQSDPGQRGYPFYAE